MAPRVPNRRREQRHDQQRRGPGDESVQAMIHQGTVTRLPWPGVQFRGDDSDLHRAGFKDTSPEGNMGAATTRSRTPGESPCEVLDENRQVVGADVPVTVEVGAGSELRVARGLVPCPGEGIEIHDIDNAAAVDVG